MALFLKLIVCPYFEEEHQNGEKCSYFSSEIPILSLPELLLLGGGPNVTRAPEMIGDQDVGGHGDAQRRQELHQEHHQRHPCPTGCRQHELDKLKIKRTWAGT